MFSGTAQVSHQVCRFFCQFCVLLCVWLVDKNKAVVSCLLAKSAIMLSERNKRKRKMWCKTWYLKRNISCDAHLLNELLETDVPWDDAIVVSAGKLRKLWDSLSELRSSLRERRLERTVVGAALLPVTTAQFTQFFRQVWRHTVKSHSLNESVQRPLGTHGTNSSYGLTTNFRTITKQVITDIFTIIKLSDISSYGVICIVKGNLS
jgi:hypothetical protein